MIDTLWRMVGRLHGAMRGAARVSRELSDTKVLLGAALARSLPRAGEAKSLAEAEFKVFSQFGDDGIIQYLVRSVGPVPATFIEFGVEDYRESNTRLLLVKDNWRGLVMDGSRKNIEALKCEDICWRHDLKAVHAFVDSSNVNSLFRENGFSGELGLLSIDVDGNDYWIWEAIDSVEPVIVVAEYNALFGARRAVTIPYVPRFRRDQAHYSNLFWGCSLKALTGLAQRKGYAFVGCNSAGNNAYFVKRERLGPLSGLEAGAAFVESRFREARDRQGRLTLVGGEERRQLIGDLQVFDLERQALVRIAEL